MPPDEAAEIREAVRPFAAVARLILMGVGDVWAAARRYGLALRTVTRPRRRTLLRLYRLGLPDGEIARRLYCTRRTVLRWRAREGLPAVADKGWRNAILRRLPPPGGRTPLPAVHDFGQRAAGPESGPGRG